MLKKNKRIELLFLDIEKDIDLEGTRLLCEGLTENKNLREINFSFYSEIDFEVFMYFCDFLKQNESIDSLEIYGNFLGPDPSIFKYFCDCLKQNNKLENLIYSHQFEEDIRNFYEIEELLNMNIRIKSIGSFLLAEDLKETTNKLFELIDMFHEVNFIYIKDDFGYQNFLSHKEFRMNLGSNSF